MDEAFLPFAEYVRRLIAIEGELADPQAGVRSRIHEYEIEMPIELDVTREQGRLAIGSAPPLYYADTTFRPSYHRIKLTARLAEESDGA